MISMTSKFTIINIYKYGLIKLYVSGDRCCLLFINGVHFLLSFTHLLKLLETQKRTKNEYRWRELITNFINNNSNIYINIWLHLITYALSKTRAASFLNGLKNDPFHKCSGVVI